MDWHPIQESWGEEILLVTSCYRNWNECWPDRLLGTLCRLDFHHLSCHLQNKCLCKTIYMKITWLSCKSLDFQANDSTGGICFRTNSLHKDSFCHIGKSKLGIGLFIHELLREPLIFLTAFSFFSIRQRLKGITPGHYITENILPSIFKINLPSSAWNNKISES